MLSLVEQHCGSAEASSTRADARNQQSRPDPGSVLHDPTTRLERELPLQRPVAVQDVRTE